MIFTAVIMIAMSGLLSAQTTKPGNGTPGTNKNSPAYVDTNKNNVCARMVCNAAEVAEKDHDFL